MISDRKVPAVSVITVVFNGARHLQDCLDSVARQRGLAIEHIVIDGGSTDGTVDMLQAWSDQLAFWVSEPDAGIADAMNKGIRKARGEWLVFLHADDFFTGADKVLKACVQAAGDVDVAAFPVFFGTPPNLEFRPPRRAGWAINLKMGMCHQGMLTRRQLFEDVGLYDTSFRIDMDYDFLMRAHRGGARFVSFHAPALAVMRDTGISSRTDWPSIRGRFLEERRIHFAHATSAWQRLAYTLYWLLYLPYRRLVALTNA